MFDKMLSAMTVAGALLLPAAAEAAPAWITGNVNLRTGPGTNYYQIMILPRGSQVEVYGCLQGYSWCDVGLGPERGWVSSRYLSIFYANQAYVPYRPTVVVPFLTFDFGYWDRYYVGRPWYAHRPPPSGWRPYQPPPQQWRPYQPPQQWQPNPPHWRPNPPQDNWRPPSNNWRPYPDNPTRPPQLRPHPGPDLNPPPGGNWRPNPPNNNWRPNPESQSNRQQNNRPNFMDDSRPRPMDPNAPSRNNSGAGQAGKPCVWINGACRTGN